MPSVRTRSVSGPTHTGKFRYGSNSPWSYRSVLLRQEQMTDTVGNPSGDNGLSHTFKRVTSLATASSEGNYLGGSGSTMDECPLVLSYSTPHLSLPSLPSDSSDGTLAVARTNPSRPHVLLPTALFELRELPSLVRKMGDNVINNAGDLHLRYVFGVAPLIADVRRLANFQRVAEKRALELSRLDDNGGLRSMTTLSHDTAAADPSWSLLMSTPYTIRSRRQVTTERKRWASCRWKPSRMFMSMDSGERGVYMRRTLLGLTASQFTQNVWNALPWSWLTDWFANTGDLIQASNNSVAHLSGSVCVMTRTLSTYVDYCYATGSRADRVRFHNSTNIVKVGIQSRSITAPTFSASVPFLTGRQLSILGSLAAVRYRG